MSVTHMSGPVLVSGVQLGLGQQSPNQKPSVPGGRIRYVGNYPNTSSLKTGLAPGDGTTPESPLSSLFGAGGGIDSLRGRINAGDIIYILPGHVETISIADVSNTGVVSATAAGYSIVGMGNGSLRPTFNWTAAASTWLLNQPGIELANLVLNFAVTAATVVVTPMTVSAANCRIVDCYINWGVSTTIGCGSTLGAIAYTTAADDCEFLNNECVNLDTAGTTGNAITLLSLNGADRIKIFDNDIQGATTVVTVGPIHFLTTASLNVKIQNNYISNTIASSTKALSSAISGVTGFIRFCSFFVNSGIVAITTTNLPGMYQCFTSNAASKNGALDVGAGTAA